MLSVDCSGVFFFCFQHLLHARDLSNNELRHLPAAVFGTLRRLQVLHLSSNQLEELDENLLQGLDQLEDVDLSRNSLYHLPPDLFAGASRKKNGNVDRGRSVTDVNPFQVCPASSR